MSRGYLLRGLVLAAGLVLGCAPAKPPGNADTVSRVFIDVRRLDSGTEFTADLSNELVTGLSRYGVQCRADERDRRARADDVAALEEFYPDIVIAIMQTDSNGVPSQAEFTLAVFRPNSAAPMWTASLSPESGGWTLGSASRIARETLAKLEEEGLISARYMPR